jgi:signal peptidase I
VNKQERAELEAEYGDVGEGAWPPVRRRPARRPWLAGALNLVVPGLGHAYVGEVRRGLWLWGAVLLVALVSSWSGLVEHFWGLAVMVVVQLGLYAYMIKDAAARARSRNSSGPGPLQRWAVCVGLVLFSTLVVSPWARSVLSQQSFWIPAVSMEPTLVPGDHLIAQKGPFDAEDLERGEVVIFQSPEDPSIDQVYRIVGLPGEMIDLVDKAVLIDGKPLDGGWPVHFDDSVTYPDDPTGMNPRSRRDQLGPLRVPEDHVFVLGDNRDFAYDSRYIGPIPIASIKARPLYIYWSRRPSEPGLPGGPTRLERTGLRVR